MDDPALLSKALVLWVVDRPAPETDDSRLVEAFGADTAARLLPDLKALQDDFFASNARHRTHDLARMGDQAIEDFRAQHPEISRAAAEQLARLYIYAFK